MEVTTNKMGCFTVNWGISNCSVLLSDTYIQSADFKLIISEKSVWAHCVFYYGFKNMRFKVRSKNGILDYDTLEFSLFSGRSINVPKDPKETSYVISKSAIFRNSWTPFRYDGNLTVCCRIRKATIETGEISIHTFLHRDDFSWNIVKLNARTCYEHTFIEKHNFLFYMRMERNADHRRTHTFEFKGKPNIGGCLSFLHIKPSILFNRGRIISEISHERKLWDIEIYPRGDPFWNFQIHLEVIFAIHKEIHNRPTSSVSVKNVNTSEALIWSSGTLKEDLLHLYTEALHSDATLTAEGKSFPVHKNILSTRSEVFRAMFEKDQMKEGREGVVVIEDLGSQTVNQMLVFLYSDVLEDINWEDASALYYAADKYAILPLKKKCTEILKAGLSQSNACDILALADKHSDQELMKSTVDFILDHKEVISSSKWEKLEESNSRLTSKIMREILLKKWVK